MTDPIRTQALFNIARELEETRKVLQQIVEQLKILNQEVKKKHV